MPARHSLSRVCHRWAAALPAAAGLACLTLITGMLPAGAATTITEFPVPSGLAAPGSVAVDSSGAVWFTDLTHRLLATVKTS